MEDQKSLVSKIRTAVVRRLPDPISPPIRAERFLQKKIAAQKVLGGPFKGMKYISESVGSVLVPKLLGCYEIELHSIVERYVTTQPCVIMDVGAAEGYYAVGLAVTCRKSRVIAFEASKKGRKVLEQMAELNSVLDRVEINGFCTPEVFASSVASNSPNLVIMDIEGGEAELLNDKVVPLLAKTDLLIELHPWVCPNIESDLKTRFANTHKAALVASRQREAADLPFGALQNALLSRWVVPKLDELRPEPMEWLILTALKR